METYGSLGFDPASRLTKLYTQHKAATPPVSVDDAPEILSLHRKFRIQKDRLIAWGLEWSDGSDTNAHGNIDESLQRAGLTELVSSVMDNIKLILDEVDQIRVETVVTPLRFPDAKIAPLKRKKTTPWTKLEREQYQDLIRDLTTALDLLCDLSRSRRMPQNGSGRSEKTDHLQPYWTQTHDDEPFSPDVKRAVKQIVKLDASSLIIPEEGPPSYDDLGAPRSSRIFGHLRHPLVLGDESQYDQDLPQPVLIEYAPYDSIYRDNHIPLPTSRLEQLFSVLNSRIAMTEGALPKLIAYFEDPQQPRMGLVFELPLDVSASLPAMSKLYDTMVPNSLNDLLQNASRIHANPSTSHALVIPPLEERFRLAHQLVSSLSSLHDQAFTHKDISSSGILLLPKPLNPLSTSTVLQNDFRRPLLGSFDLFSEYAIDPTPSFTHQNIYRHPDDPKVKGTANSEDHDAKFDLYSLGIVLLEIGLWVPLTDIYKEKYSLQDFKTRIVKVWVRKLAGKCGSLYMRVVQDCFNVSSRQSDSGDAMRQVYGRMKLWLARCCLLDADMGDTLSDIADVTAPDTVSFPEVTSPEIVSHQADFSPYRSLERRSEPTVVVAPDNAKPNIFWSKDLPEDIDAYWQNELADRIWDIVIDALGKSRESIEVFLNYAGDTEATARLTLMVICKGTQLVQAALMQHLQMSQYDVDIIVYKGQIVRSKSPKNIKGGTRRSAGPGTQALNPYHQQRPICGASIGAWRDNEHLGPVTFGGIVMVDGNPFGMSVHHMLEEEDDEGGAVVRSSNNGRPEIPPAYDELSREMAGLSIDQEDGDCSGIDLGGGNNILITQPALDDVEEDFFPNEEDKDEDHLDSHSFGHVLASSGIRRTVHQGRTQEMDWVLFQIRDSRLQFANVIAGGKRHYSGHPSTSPPPLLDPVSRQRYNPDEDLYPSRIAPSSDLSNLAVHCFGRTCGLGSGNIGPSMRRARFPGRRKPSWTWCVTGGIGSGGDSGAWIIDNEQGRVCGHVLAWNNTANLAYFSPMEVMFADIKRTLHASEVCLPGGCGGAEEARAAQGSKELTGQQCGQSPSPNLLAHHVLMSGNPGHLEREWAARRAALGQRA